MNAPLDGTRLAPAAINQYIHLEERARAARDTAELMFCIANEPWRLFPYRQGLVWSIRDGRARLRTVSGLAQLAEDSPYTVWLRGLGDWLAARPGDDPEFVVIDDLPESMREGWAEWLPVYLLTYPVLAPDGRRLGLAAYALDEAPADGVQQLMARLVGAYGHAWAALEPARARGLGRSWSSRRIAWGALALAVAVLCVPVRLSVLAPAEVIALDAIAISSPIDGVIKTFHVQPNQSVDEGDPLFTLDETTLRNRREVALKQLQVARADALAAAQKAFANDQSRAELASLNGKVAERQAELVYIDDLMKRIEVRSPGRGVVVFGDVNDWQGKPVVTGERVALLADPADAGMLIWLPVPDAINLDEGADVKLYLQVSPLRPLTGKLSQTSYQATQSPDGIVAYRLRARFDALDDEQRALARIGLRGTAKIYGSRAPLAYYLFRRPLAGLRELTGW
ncbi:MAG: HlyD family efflux transporter periplasmic adaptor subunit [Burkholderiaceae bacterium]